MAFQLRAGPERRGGTNRRLARVRLPEERLVHCWAGRIDASTRDSVMLVEGRAIPAREETSKSRYVCLMEYVTAGPQACTLCIASSTVADPPSRSSRPYLPDAHARRSTGALNETDPPVFA